MNLQLRVSLSSHLYVCLSLRLSVSQSLSLSLYILLSWCFYICNNNITRLCIKIYVSSNSTSYTLESKGCVWLLNPSLMKIDETTLSSWVCKSFLSYAPAREHFITTLSALSFLLEAIVSCLPLVPTIVKKKIWTIGFFKNSKINIILREYLKNLVIDNLFYQRFSNIRYACMHFNRTFQKFW